LPFRIVLISVSIKESVSEIFIKPISLISSFLIIGSLTSWLSAILAATSFALAYPSKTFYFFSILKSLTTLGVEYS